MKDYVFDLIEQEKVRQKEGLELIPSENYVSKEETMKNRKLFTQERLNELDNIDENFWDKFCIENWGDLCVLSEEEVSGITELWDEITM